jgi:hypothetical protein
VITPLTLELYAPLWTELPSAESRRGAVNALVLYKLAGWDDDERAAEALSDPDDSCCVSTGALQKR